MCKPGNPDHEAGVERRSDARRRAFPGHDYPPHHTAGTAVPIPALFLITALVCGGGRDAGPSKDNQRRDIMRGRPFRSWDTDPRRDHRDRPHPLALPALALTALACGTKSPGGREEDDPMHHRLKREGRSIRDQFGLGDDDRRRMVALPATLTAAMALCWTQGTDRGKSDRDGPVFRLHAFTADAVDILTGPDKGGRFLAKGDVAGWARYVFLDDSDERHPYNCRYVRMLRSMRRLGTWPPA